MRSYIVTIGRRKWAPWPWIVNCLIGVGLNGFAQYRNKGFIVIIPGLFLCVSLFFLIVSFFRIHRSRTILKEIDTRGLADILEAHHTINEYMREREQTRKKMTLMAPEDQIHIPSEEQVLALIDPGLLARAREAEQYLEICEAAILDALHKKP